MKRLIDANINRICEGLRVVEDYLRFEIFNKNLTDTITTLKEIRHYLRKKIFSNKSFINSRDVKKDPGTDYQKIESSRKTINDLIKANIYRIEEGLRVLEESFKMENNLKLHVKKIKSFRFTIYEIEKQILHIINNKIDLNYMCSLDISKKYSNELKKIIKNLLKNNITALEIYSKTMSNFDFYKMTLLIINQIDQIPVIIKERLDIAICTDCTGITISNNNIPINVIKKYFSGLIGLHIENNNKVKENLYDFYLVDEKYDKKQNIINTGQTACKIKTVKNEELYITYYSSKLI